MQAKGGLDHNVQQIRKGVIYPNHRSPFPKIYTSMTMVNNAGVPVRRSCPNCGSQLKVESVTIRVDNANEAYSLMVGDMLALRSFLKIIGASHDPCERLKNTVEAVFKSSAYDAQVHFYKGSEED